MLWDLDDAKAPRKSMFYIVGPKIGPSCLKMAPIWFLDCLTLLQDALVGATWGHLMGHLGATWHHPDHNLGSPGVPHAGATPTDPHLDPSISLLSQFAPKWHAMSPENQYIPTPF